MTVRAMSRNHPVDGEVNSWSNNDRGSPSEHLSRTLNHGGQHILTDRGSRMSVTTPDVAEETLHPGLDRPR
jgi:hypothetical protein